MSELTWNTRFVQIWEKLINVAKGIKTEDNTPVFNPNYVFWGEKFAPDHYPSCFVCPLPINIESATFRHNFNNYDFEFGVVVRNSDTKQGYLDAMAIVGKLYDAIVADPQLGKSVCKTECIRAFPNWRGLGSGMEAFWGGLLVRVTDFGT